MHLGLENKVVLVTGGTKGIGRSITRGFLDEGSIVHFCSRTKADVEASEKQLAKDYPQAKAYGSTVDVADQTQLENWVTSCAEQNGRLDVVVANVSALAIEDTAESWRKAFETDLLGLHVLTQAAIPHLEKTGGNIVTISSVSGRDIDFTTPSPYGPAKAAVIHYTASLARKLAPKGVRANTCSPGNIYINDGVWGNVEKNMPELFKSQMDKNPMGRMGKAEEISDVVCFLASERASFVSGTNVCADGALCQGVQF
ncbi:uncharacterized protein LTR77_009060 [Saxophila tyrrhenica]|uniref:Uncharacterized protein n=1 Tax=Saxophila tyrrhenica TaxID=1690608 RepID=A0AAV9P2U5_9PEZI|nr:hypothetical protein LTR77_009060 [Saxophila tyrrhenica]